MRNLVFGVLAAFALPAVAVAQLEPAVDLVCTTLGCTQACEDNLSQCQSDLSTCNGDLGSCNSGYASCQSDLGTCDSERSSCQSDLGSCDAALASCSEALDAAAFFPASGQTTSYAGGDDGALQYGATLSYTDNGDGTITDNNTRLVWEKKVKRDGVQDLANLHDADNRYVWTGSGNIFTWVAALNAANFAGHNDWRIPNRRELESIVDLERVNPSINPAFNGGSCGAACTDITNPACSCTVSSNYWSSSTYRDKAYGAWIVSFYDGSVYADYTTTSYYVRAVRGGSQ